MLLKGAVTALRLAPTMANETTRPRSASVQLSVSDAAQHLGPQQRQPLCPGAHCLPGLAACLPPLFHLAAVRVVHCIRYGMHRQLECLVHIR